MGTGSLSRTGIWHGAAAAPRKEIRRPEPSPLAFLLLCSLVLNLWQFGSLNRGAQDEPLAGASNTQAEVREETVATNAPSRIVADWVARDGNGKFTSSGWTQIEP